MGRAVGRDEAGMDAAPWPRHHSPLHASGPPRPLQARQLAETVLAHGGRTAMQAEGLTILGRACHALGQLNDAYKAYQQANQVDPKLPLPRLGLAQLSVLNPQQGAGNAASLLESVLVDAPHWIDALEVRPAAAPRGRLGGCRRLRPRLGVTAAGCCPRLGVTVAGGPPCAARSVASLHPPAGAGPRVPSLGAERHQGGAAVQGGGSAAAGQRRAVGATGRPAVQPGARRWAAGRVRDVAMACLLCIV